MSQPRRQTASPGHLADRPGLNQSMMWTRAEVICAFGKWPPGTGGERGRHARAGPAILPGVTAARGQVLGDLPPSRAVTSPAHGARGPPQMRCFAIHTQTILEFVTRLSTGLRSLRVGARDSHVVRDAGDQVC